jgi:rhamnosyltransferase
MVDILLATYNGAAYIEEQVRSLIAQTYTQWQLLVHDDGSTDNSLAICNEYKEKDNRIIVIHQDSLQTIIVSLIWFALWFTQNAKKEIF